jgi:type VI protein secretion system component Hcp
MDRALRASIRRTMAVALVIAVGGAGWVLHSVTSSSHPSSARKSPAALNASDLLRAAASASAGIYLQYDGVTGPPGVTFRNDAPITSFSFGVSRVPITTSGTRGGSTPNVSDISLTHTMDKYSAPLLQRSLTGSGNDTAVLYFTEVNQKTGALVKFLEIDLGHVLISSFQTSASGATRPTESLSLNFTTITLIAHLAGSPEQTITYDLP